MNPTLLRLWQSAAAGVDDTTFSGGLYTYTYGVSTAGGSSNVPVSMYGGAPYQYTYNVSTSATDPNFPTNSFGTNYVYTYNVSTISANPPTTYDGWMLYTTSAAAPSNCLLYGFVGTTPTQQSVTLTSFSNPVGSFSPDGVFLITCATSGTSMFRRRGDVWSAVSFDPSGGSYMASWSADSSRIVLAGAGAATTAAIQRVPNGNAFVRTAGGTYAAARTCAISPDGTYFVFSPLTTGAPTLYKWPPGVVTPPATTSLGTPTGAVTSTCNDIAWSPDGQYVAAVTQSAAANQGLVIYKRTGDTWANLNITTPGVSTYQSVTWSPDGALVVATTSNNTTPLVAFSHVGDVFTQETVTSPGAGSYGLAWRTASELWVTRSVSPYVRRYTKSGNTLTLDTNPTPQPANTPLVLPRQLSLYPTPT